MRFPTAIPPAPKPVELTSALPAQPPGTTLQVVDDADPDAPSFFCQQRHSPLSSRYPQRQRSAPDYYRSEDF